MKLPKPKAHVAYVPDKDLPWSWARNSGYDFTFRMQDLNPKQVEKCYATYKEVDSAAHIYAASYPNEGYVCYFKTATDAKSFINKLALKGIDFENPNLLIGQVDIENGKRLANGFARVDIKAEYKGLSITLYNLSASNVEFANQTIRRLESEKKLGPRTMCTGIWSGDKDRQELKVGFVNGDDINTIYNELRITMPFAEGHHAILAKISKAKSELQAEQQGR